MCFRKLVADRLADFHLGLADKIVGGCEPAEVGYSLKVPNDDGWFHAMKYDTHRRFISAQRPEGSIFARASVDRQSWL
jgi:YD repeat-containing protein